MGKASILIGIALIIVIALTTTITASAGGDKVRGENGSGDTNQICVTPDYDGDGCPYGDMEGLMNKE